MDQRFGQMRDLLEEEEPIELRELRVRRIEDDPGRDVVQHYEAIDHAPVIFGEARRDPSATIVADECNTLIAEMSGDLPDVFRHGPLIVADVGLVGVAVPAQIGHDYVVIAGQIGPLLPPRVPGLGVAMKQDDGCALSGFCDMHSDPINGNGMAP